MNLHADTHSHGLGVSVSQCALRNEEVSLETQSVFSWRRLLIISIKFQQGTTLTNQNLFQRIFAIIQICIFPAKVKNIYRKL